MAHQERVNIAVFIDFDNIEIGVKTTLGEHFDIGTILDALKERGEVVTKIAYADWTRAGEYSRKLTQHAIRLVQRNLTPGGDKNGADINLALDALEMAFTHPHINAYVIVGGDSDFLSLVEKLKQYDKKVFVVGGRSFTSVILQRNCHEFIAYENLMRKPAPSRAAAAAAAPRSGQAVVADRPGVPHRAARAQDPGRPRGFAADRPAQEHAAAARLDLLRAQLRRVVVPRLRREARAGRPRPAEALRPQRDGRAEPGVRRRRREVPPKTTAEATRRRARRRDNVVAFRPAGEQPQAESTAGAEQPAAAWRTGRAARRQRRRRPRRGRSCWRAATSARWPMYLRNVKQILRAGNFDERRYGFGGLMDLLKACQREGLSASNATAAAACASSRARTWRAPRRRSRRTATRRTATRQSRARRRLRLPTTCRRDDRRLRRDRAGRHRDRAGVGGGHDRGAARPRQAACAARPRGPHRRGRESPHTPRAAGRSGAERRFAQAGRQRSRPRRSRRAVHASR